MKSSLPARSSRGVQSDQQVMRIIVYGLSLSFSVLIASMQTVRATATGFTFEFNLGTVLAFVFGAALVVPCFQVIFYSKRVWLRRVAMAVVIAIGLAGFIYPLRFVPGEARPAIFIGLTVAAFALSIVGVLMLLVSRFLTRDEKRHSEE